MDFESFRKPTVIYKLALLSGKEWLWLWYLDDQTKQNKVDVD